MAIAIKIENLSKQYRLGLVSTKTLSHDLNRWWTTNIRGKEDPYLKIGEVNDRLTILKSSLKWGRCRDGDEQAGKGTHQELMKNCSVYREIALSQLSKEELAS